SLPPVEDGDGDFTPYQFNRHAPGRISTSPTLRRLRNSTPSLSQVFSLQNSTESGRGHNQVPQTESTLLAYQRCTLHSQQCSLTSNSGMHTDSLTLKENSTLADTLSVPPHPKDDFVDDNTLQNTREISPSSLTKGKQNSQECLQVSNAFPRSLVWYVLLIAQTELKSGTINQAIAALRVVIN
uniref:Uncharacterized protein n=1 Tax=Podarcis muralis TaxID=64176 RepID=A0A670IS92_PODMU